jgi:hypothetical protein
VHFARHGITGGFAGCRVKPHVPTCWYHVMFQSCVLVAQAIHPFPASVFSLTAFLSVLLLFRNLGICDAISIVGTSCFRDRANSVHFYMIFQHWYIALCIASGGFARCYVMPFVSVCCHHDMFQSCVLAQQECISDSLFPSAPFCSEHSDLESKSLDPGSNSHRWHIMLQGSHKLGPFLHDKSDLRSR